MDHKIKEIFFVKDCEEEILISIDKQNGFGENPVSSLKGMEFYEFDLEELGLPSAEELLEATLEIKKTIGLKGWSSQGKESREYKGFSLTYNPDYVGDQEGLYHQTWGTALLNQNFGRVFGTGGILSTKNTYYDSYAFRNILPDIEKYYDSLLNKLSMPLLRSRVAWLYGYCNGYTKNDSWHVDEYPYHLLRINIPLQTYEEYVLDISGEDDFGNRLEILDKHLEIGKAYIWNTRIPHRVTLNKICINPKPRIHIVLGLCTWFDYNKEQDSFIRSSRWNMNLDYIIKNRLFLKSWQKSHIS
jgi:hypothetical protein